MNYQYINSNLDISFFVPGEPTALKRHRSFKNKKTGFTCNYDPSKGDKQDFLAKAMIHRPGKPYDEPIFVELIFNFSRPKSHYGTGKNANLIKASAPEWHTSVPDLDNLEKMVFDALNGIFWKDDRIACQKISMKQYTDAGPGVSIRIARVKK